MSGVWAELRQGVRSLRRRPALVAVVVLTLALGIGANSAVFAILQEVVLRPLPYRAADRLVLVRTEAPAAGADLSGVPVADYLDLRREARRFEGLAAIHRPDLDERVVLRGEGPPERVSAGRVHGGFFRLLGVGPALGRAFTAADAEPGAPPVALLAHGAWERRFGGDPGVVGRTVRLNGEPHTVVGVLPERFEFELGTEEPEFWLPARWPAALEADREAHLLHVVGRLAPGADREAAAADLGRIARRLEAEHPETNGGRRFRATSLHEAMVGDVTPALRVLGLAALLVLLVACVNVSVLLLARGDRRREEIAIRRAMGATPGRVGRVVRTEGLLLAAAGAVPGVVLGLVGARVLTRLSPVHIPRLEAVRPDPALLGFVAVLCVAAGLLAGALPAARARRQGPGHLLGDRGSVGRPGGRFDLSRALVAAEAGLVLVLLSGAVLASRSLGKLLNVDPGFDPGGRVTLSVDLPPDEYRSPEAMGRFLERARRRAEAVPGVRRVGFVSNTPLDPASWWGPLHVRGRDIARGEQQPVTDWEAASPGYFRAVGIPLLRGRAFRPEDDADAPAVAVINETMARRLWPDGDPIGAMISGISPEGPWRRVVGVVGDVKQQGLGSETRPHMYIHWAQVATGASSFQLVAWTGEDVGSASPDDAPGAGAGREAGTGGAGATPAAGVTGALRTAIRELDARAVVGPPRPLEELIRSSAARTRFHAVLLGTFGALALLLGLAGIYGVVSHWVGGRRREIGVRAALGAAPVRVLGLVLRQGLAPTAAGAVAGLLVVLLGGRVMEGLLFGVSPRDPITLAGVAAAVLSGAALAALLPAVRAMRLEPARVLREE